MAGLFVPLNVGYADDDKIIDAGPMAELLYIRSLAFVKRARSDGWIASNQLRTIATRIPAANRLADRLVELGLWERNGAGWYVRSWLQHNPAVADIHQVKSTAGVLGNHRRWHIGVGGEPNPECGLCRKEGLV